MLPNSITALRLALTPVIVWFLLRADWHAAAIWFAVAAFTDFLDGYSARRLGLTSKSGQFFDPVADKVLLVAVTVACAYMHRIAVWFVVIVAARDVLLLAGSVVGLLFTSYRKYQPTQLGKLSTLLQIGVVVAALALPSVAAWLVWPSAAVTVASGAHYLWRAARGAAEA